MPARAKSKLGGVSRSARRARRNRRNETPTQRAYRLARTNQRGFENRVLLKAVTHGYDNTDDLNNDGCNTSMDSQNTEVMESPSELIGRGIKTEDVHESLSRLEEEPLVQSLLRQILEAIQGDPERFEKPSPKSFYDQIRSKSSILQSKTWRGLKYRMGIMKTTYFLAAMKQEQKLSQTHVNSNEEEFTDYIYKICPHFDALDVIFRHQSDKPTIVYDHVTAHIGEDGDTETKYSIADNETKYSITDNETKYCIADTGSKINALPECENKNLPNDSGEVELKFEVESRCGTPEAES